MTRQDHQRIYEDLSRTMREDKERRRLEIERLSKPTISERAFNYGMAAICIAGIILILHFSK
jgi:hypothetical protein